MSVNTHTSKSIDTHTHIEEHRHLYIEERRHSCSQVSSIRPSALAQADRQPSTVHCRHLTLDTPRDTSDGHHYLQVLSLSSRPEPSLPTSFVSPSLSKPHPVIAPPGPAHMLFFSLPVCFSPLICCLFSPPRLLFPLIGHFFAPYCFWVLQSQGPPPLHPSPE